MLDVIRRHGLIAFMLALALVSLTKALSAWGSGRYYGPGGVALLMAAIVAEELERRELVAPSVYLQVVRWGGLLGAVGVLLWE